MRGLLLSGGAFRGIIQLPVVLYLASIHKYDFVYGVSAGALTGIMVAQDKLDELARLWSSVNGLGNFLKLKWWWPFNGIYSMKPLRSHIENNVSLTDIKIPFAAGVVSLTDGEYYNIHSNHLRSNTDLWNAIEASCSISGIMTTPKLIINGGIHLGADGGFRNIIPVPPPGQLIEIDAVTCTPLKRITSKIQKGKSGIINATRGMEIMEAEIFEKDIQEIKTKTGARRITVYAPQADPGPSFQADKTIMDYRYNLGLDAINYPVIL